VVYEVYRYTVWAGTACAVLYWLGRENWAGLELLALAFLAAPFHVPIAYRFFRRSLLYRRRDALGLPEATDQEILAFITEALDDAYIDWEWRPSRTGPSQNGAAQWREIAIGEGEQTIFVLADNGMIEVQHTDEDPEIFLDAVECVQYIIELKGVYDPINKVVPFDDPEESAPG
jgi:hypothetical protein